MPGFLEKLKKRTTQKKIEEINLTLAAIPTKIYIFDISYDLDNEKLVDQINQFRTKYPKSMLDYNKNHTNIRSWHSDYTTQKITDILDPLINITAKKICQVFTAKNAEVYNIWINMYSNNDSANRHSHGFFGVSTVYYPYVENKSTPIIFDNNERDNRQEYEIFPKTGMLLCFHSLIPHKVPQVNEQNRISIAANFNIILDTENRDPIKWQDTSI